MHCSNAIIKTQHVFVFYREKTISIIQKLVQTPVSNLHCVADCIKGRCLDEQVGSVPVMLLQIRRRRCGFPHGQSPFTNELRHVSRARRQTQDRNEGAMFLDHCCGIVTAFLDKDGRLVDRLWHPTSQHQNSVKVSRGKIVDGFVDRTGFSRFGRQRR